MGAEQAAREADAVGYDTAGERIVLRALDSEELAWRAKQGCQASFTELVHRYAPRLQAFLHRRTRDRHDAEDLVQDTFIKAYENLDRYDDSWRFSTWLFTIATRLAVSRGRRRQPRLCSLETHAQAHAHAPDMTTDERERQESLWAMVSELPGSQPQVLWLRYGEDMSVKEIAHAMGKSQVCIKVLLCRARMRLAQRLKERLNAGEVNGCSRR